MLLIWKFGTWFFILLFRTSCKVISYDLKPHTAEIVYDFGEVRRKTKHYFLKVASIASSFVAGNTNIFYLLSIVSTLKLNIDKGLI